MSEPVGRKVAGNSTVVRAGDLGPTGTQVKGKLEFVAPDGSGATAEQVAAVERAGGRVKKPVTPVAEPAGE